MRPNHFYRLLMVRSKLALLEAFKDIEKKRDWDHGYRHAVRGKGKDPFDHRDPDCRDDDRCYEVGYKSGRARKTGERGPVHFGPRSSDKEKVEKSSESDEALPEYTKSINGAVDSILGKIRVKSAVAAVLLNARTGNNRQGAAAWSGDVVLDDDGAENLNKLSRDKTGKLSRGDSISVRKMSYSAYVLLHE